jgi:hypothetical protein
LVALSINNTQHTTKSVYDTNNRRQPIACHTIDNAKVLRINDCRTIDVQELEAAQNTMAMFAVSLGHGCEHIEEQLGEDTGCAPVR